jgi:hypothetical protein
VQKAKQNKTIKLTDRARVILIWRVKDFGGNNNMKTIIPILLVCVAFEIEEVQGLTPTPISNSEYWLDDDGPENGNGTLAAPWRVPNQAAFDSAMKDLTADGLVNIKIHLNPGTYYTAPQSGGAHDWCLKPGMKLFGAGRELTVIEISSGTSITAVRSAYAATDVEVADLTIKCNGLADGSAKRTGVSLYGDRNAVRRVKVIDPSAFAGNEAFAIHVGPKNSNGTDNTNGVGSVIEDCEVIQNYKAGWLNGIQLANGQGISRFNRVFMPVWDAGDADTLAYNMSGVTSLLFTGNYSVGSKRAFYHDFLSAYNVLISHNHFVDARESIYFQYDGNTRGNIAIMFNTIEVCDATYGNTWQFAIHLWNHNTAGNSHSPVLRVIGNVLKMDDDAAIAPGKYVRALVLGGFKGALIANNFIHAQFSVNNQGSLGVVFENNIDLDGNLYIGVNQVLPSMSVQRRTLSTLGSSGAPTVLNYQDKYLGVGATSGFIELPSASNWPGKEYMIVAEGSETPSITVQAKAGENLVGAGVVNNSTTITARYGFVRVTSDGTKWIKY